MFEVFEKVYECTSYIERFGYTYLHDNCDAQLVVWQEIR